MLDHYDGVDAHINYLKSNVFKPNSSKTLFSQMTFEDF